MNGLSERERRLAALGILALLLAAAWWLVAMPLLDGFSARREARAEAQAALARDARLVAGFPALRARYAALSRSAGAALIPAARVAHDRVLAEVARSAVSLQSLRPAETGPGEVRLQGCLQGAFPKLIDVLQRLENAPPYAAVRTLSITAGGVDAAAGPSALQACFEVSYRYADLR